MIDSKTFKSSVEYNKEVEEKSGQDFSNPLKLKIGLTKVANLACYSQVLSKPAFDKDSFEVLTKIDAMKKLTPRKLELPHSFNIEEINGERIVNEVGKFEFIREYDSNLIIEYYPSKDNSTVEYILERDKKTYAVKVKIEPIIKENIQTKTRVTIFDEQINDKYTMFQIEDGGIISSITEFSGKGKGFRTLFINPKTSEPLRYVEAKDDKSEDFVFLDSKLNQKGEISEIKKVTNDKEFLIQYTETQKIIDVRQKEINL